MPTAFWQKMPHVMLAKVAEALALRRAFPMELSGVYSTEEMTQADMEEQGKEKFPRLRGVKAPEADSIPQMATTIVKPEQERAATEAEETRNGFIEGIEVHEHDIPAPDDDRCGSRGSSTRRCGSRSGRWRARSPTPKPN